MKYLLTLLFALPAFAAPPNNWPSEFSASVTLTGVTQGEHFLWQDASGNWRNDTTNPWDLVLIPPDRLSAFVLIDFNSYANIALRLDSSTGQFIVDDPANNIQNTNPAFVPESYGLWLTVVGLVFIRRPR